MATIRKRGEKYQVQVRRKGLRSINRSFHTYKDAEAWSRQTEVQADRQELPPDPNQLRSITLRDLVIRYRDTVSPSKRTGPYGGWWQAIPSRYRRYITIDENATREFDYSNLHAAMLYAREGLALPDDAYTLPGISDDYRKLIKKTFFKLINAGANQAVQTPKMSAMPRGWTWAQLQTAIREKHAPISQYFNSGIGLRLQRQDSDIAETVMHRMMAKGVLVLPVHDSFITFHQQQAAMRDMMALTYREAMQHAIGIDADPSFVDQWNSAADIGVKFDPHDVVENVQAHAGYAG